MKPLMIRWKMSQSYEAEQKQPEENAQALQQEMEVQKRQHENIELFIQKADKYVRIGFIPLDALINGKTA